MPAAGVYVRTPAAHTAPSELVLRCTPAGTSVAELRQADVRMGGAWVRVANASDRRMAVVVEVGATRGPSAIREILPRTSGWMRFALPPGRWRIGCFDPADARQDPPASRAYRARLVEVTLRDPHGWYRSEALACERQAATIADYAAGAGGETDVTRLPALAREAIPYARATDVVGDAGYAVRQPTNRAYRLLRGGEVIGLVTFVDGGRGWLLTTTVTCSPAPA